MSKRPSSSGRSEKRYPKAHPEAHVPEDDVADKSLKGALRKLVAPRPRPDERGPRKKIRGPGPVHRGPVVHRGLMLSFGRRGAQGLSIPVICGAVLVIAVAAVAMLSLGG